MDARKAISSAKHYIHTPMPLFRYLCSLDISRAHEHVFLLHWCEGQIRGDWTSKIPIACVASKLSLSESTVKRAYRELAELGLIRRYSQGRNRHNPMRSDITITEVTIPDAVAAELMSASDRAGAATAPAKQAPEAAVESQPPAPAKARPAYQALHDEQEVDTTFGAPDIHRPRRKAPVSASTKRTDCERWKASEDELPPECAIARQDPSVRTPEGNHGQTRSRLSSRFAIKLRRALRARLDESKVDEPWRQMLWTIGHGFLSEQPLPKAFNVAMKLLRMNRWMTPWDMPDDWQWTGA